MKVTAIIPIYKRHDLTRIVFSHLKRQQSKYKFNVIVAGSEGKKSRDLAREFNFAYIEIKNFPVSDKNNKLIKASKDLDSDLVCLIGSDDFLSDKYWDLVNTLDPTFEGFYGLKDLYYYSTKTRDLTYFSGYGNINQSIGAGRIFSKALLQKMSYKIWSGYKNQGLDSNCSSFVRSKGGKEIVLKENIFLLDVKHAYNITSHLIMKTGVPAAKSIMQKELGTETYREISSLKYVEGNDIIKLPDNNNPNIFKISYMEMIEIEIIVAKAGMQVGDRRTVRGHIAKSLIQRGIAKRVEPKKEEVIEPTEEQKPKVEPKAPKKKTVKKSKNVNTKK